mmetsp:Transcript_15206/g.23016  ORF Transcript_15206/g.23016 Transcript_15206/m.23016 type:complete len:212 (-) Transcript_15206:128-763(-)
MTTVDEDHEFNYPETEARSHTLSYMVPPPPRCFYQFKIGRMYVVSAKRVVDETGGTVTKIKCILGACWPMTFITMAVIAAVSFIALSGFLEKLGFIWTIAAIFLIGSTLGSLMLTGISDPGIVPRKQAMDVEGQDLKRRWMPGIKKGNSYCDESQVVVKNMDHFCPWTGTVIADGNMIFFQVFIASLCTLLGFIAVVCFVSVSGKRVPHST